MTRKNNSGLVLAAVVATIPVLGWTLRAEAQYQTGTGGHALDASNRVGSGGVNPVGGNGSTNGYSNSTNVFTGNVSGLNYFHGRTNGIFDSNTVDANTESSASDNLNRFSAPANGSAPAQGGGNIQAYYSSSRITTALPNFVQTPNGQGFMPAPAISPLAIDSDSRLGAVNMNNSPTSLLPAPGEVDMAGPVDPAGQQSLYTMSPLYGVRKNDSGNAADTFFLSQYSNYGQTGLGDRSRMDAATVRRMQDEVNNSALPNDQQNGGDKSATPDGSNGTTPGGNGGGNGDGNGVGPGTTPGAVNTGKSSELRSSALGSTQLAAQPLSSTIGSDQLDNSLSNGQSTQNRMLVPAARQSAQIQALEKRYAGQKLTDMQASQLFNQQEMLLKQQDAKAAAAKAAKAAKAGGLAGADGTAGAKNGAGTGTAAGKGFGDAGSGTAPRPEVNLPPVVTDANAHKDASDNQPFVITSLATGIKAKGLADLLKTAEDQMRGGKFSDAIDSYNSAGQVAPNNPFVPLGRSFAEMGRSYYAKADTDLTRAITAEPAILVGQYDLKGFIGDERVQFIQKDLQDIASTEKGARAPVLLAYIAHNTGDDKTAASELDEATNRGGYTALVNAMREAWNLKAGK